MNVRALGRLLVATAAGVVTSVGLVVYLNYVNGQDGFMASTAATNPGWLVPLISGVSVAGIVWSVMRSDIAANQLGEHARSSCETCGGMVLEDWRMCPHCGEQFESDPRTRATC